MGWCAPVPRRPRFSCSPALHPALHRQPGAHRARWLSVGDDAPRRCRQVVRPPYRRFTARIQVADLPAQRRPAQGGSFAQNAGELNLVKGGRALRESAPRTNTEITSRGPWPLRLLKERSWPVDGSARPSVCGGWASRSGGAKSPAAGPPGRKAAPPTGESGKSSPWFMWTVGPRPAPAHAVEVAVHSHPPVC